MIRFIFVVLFLVVFLILSIPVMLVEWLIGKKSPNMKDYSSLRIVQSRRIYFCKLSSKSYRFF